MRDAIAEMKSRGISCLPVLTGNKLVGILTDSDLWSLLHTLMDVIGEAPPRNLVARAVTNPMAVGA